MPRPAHLLPFTAIPLMLLLMAGSPVTILAQSNEGDAAFLTNPAMGPHTNAPAPPKASSAKTISRIDVNDMAVKSPEAESPFFIERQEAKAALVNAGREGYGMYVPKPPHPPIQQQIKNFFGGMFGSLKHDRQSESAPMTLNVDPSEFSLSQTPELDVSLKLSNARKKEIELLYPDNQRLEILTKDSSGTIISRWSEDRAFDSQEGFVMINPDEFIIYAEKISTSRMKPGQTYTIEASLANQEGYSTNTTITPRP